MARKRRTKKRKGTSTRQDPAQGAPSTMSTTDELASHSSDGLSSGVRETESAATEMTSIMSEETSQGVLEADDDWNSQEEEDMEVDDGEDDNHNDGFSVFAPSHYPRASESHRTEMPYMMMQSHQDMSSTRSFMERELDYQWENGRRYCGPHYHLPNDEWEMCRMSLIHRVYLHVFDGKLSTVPLENPQRVLDVGTGIGEWAIGVADEFPNCEVIGTDISAIAPTSIPMNCFFEVDDAELEWERELDSFDLVHFRHMMAAFEDWNFIYREAFKVIKPGGWIELLEWDDQQGFKKFLSEFPPTSEIHELSRDLTLAGVKAGRARGVAHMNPRMLTDAGFTDIKLTEQVIPINVEASEGKLWLIVCIDGLEAECLRPLTKYMGWDPERVKTACHNVAKEMARLARDPVKSHGLIVKARVLVGRKPVSAVSAPRVFQRPVDDSETDDTAREDNYTRHRGDEHDSRTEVGN
ncbi:Secondary metabolism regulator LAE1 [Colletotrichum sidae]|uniref:Secondary metabolism regulator LAE1 n=3 Tax=Colletotrichum orbiculare species complex TaxID=2707354 RepID=A0A4R8RNL2_COLTR|nr:Secondary metabolism regulator LAE1 [Colletotrichum trifolii]TDZ87540.1 Secondary metabolism regulator LAE1 [Colletotrichum sidae]